PEEEDAEALCEPDCWPPCPPLLCEPDCCPLCCCEPLCCDPLCDCPFWFCCAICSIWRCRRSASRRSISCCQRSWKLCCGFLCCCASSSCRLARASSLARTSSISFCC